MRHFVYRDQHIWEIDEFMGENAGLIVAEIELSQIGESFVKPDWLGVEVSDDLRYYNNNLAKNPFKDWDK
jgi:adenylate cyclase